MLSINTSYRTSTGCPEPYLRRIAEAGFTHIHWCHQKVGDFLYSTYEIRQIREWLSHFELQLLGLHGSYGTEKRWTSAAEYERLSGVDLVKNRIEMAAELSTDVVVMHCGNEAEDPEKRDSHLALLRRSLDELEPFARACRVRIALENGCLRVIKSLLSEHSPDYLGLCFDSGHANMHHDMEQLDSLKDHLISMHLHDNDGVWDRHAPLFSGTVDWRKLAGVIADSSYGQCVNMEVSAVNMQIEDDAGFLRRLFEDGRRFSDMIEAERAGSKGA